MSRCPLGDLADREPSPTTNDGEDLTVQREARCLVPRRGVSTQRTIDAAYGRGVNWTPGHT
ncbi:hypothetical protein [Streptomyces sp. NPDC057429]|uniref:hypothetical protein n=1 Tax=Streptomyces sp. NPDC057429 TaxID=3346130 RepID=UPI0036CF9C31